MATPIEERGDPFDSPTANLGKPPRVKESSSVYSSGENSRPASLRGRPERKKRVGFGEEAGGAQSPRISWVEPNRSLPPTLEDDEARAYSPGPSGASTPGSIQSLTGSGERLIRSSSNSPSRSHLPQLSRQQTEEIYKALGGEQQPIVPPRPRPAIRRTPSDRATPVEEIPEEDHGTDPDTRHRRKVAQDIAFQRGKRLENDERIRSAGNSRFASPERLAVNVNDIPLQDLSSKRYDDEDTDDEEALHMPNLNRARKEAAEARRLVRAHTQANGQFHSEAGLRSGATTPTEESRFFEDYQSKPTKYRGGILSSLLKLSGNSGDSSRRDPRTGLPRSGHMRSGSGDTDTYSADPTPTHSPTGSGTTTPTGNGRHKWLKPKRTQSSSSLAQLVGSSASLASPGVTSLGEHGRRIGEAAGRPSVGGRSWSSNALSALHRISHRPKRERQSRRVADDIAEFLAMQKYLMKLCKCLMLYGAPTHRLEEWMMASARALEIDAQFLYIPGSMIVSFDDQDTHTTEVKLIKVVPGLDMGRLRDVHQVYKEVVHDKLPAADATSRLKDISARGPKYSKWVLVLVYGLASASVGPFAFGANLIDLPIAFFLGCILGILHQIVAPRSDVFSNVFEVLATVITSFLARAFGSIRGGDLFCFAALAQSSIALILPGYIVLCASLELQSRSIVAGSVRMVYAIIYSLFLGFGIMIGAALYGVMDINATSETTCRRPMENHWFFFFVPAFALCLIVINQAKWKQAPVMLVIAFVGYLANYWSSQSPRLTGNTQVANTFGALVIGVLANANSRWRIEDRAVNLWQDVLQPRWKQLTHKILRRESPDSSPSNLEAGQRSSSASNLGQGARTIGYSLAATAMLPAIFVQVPSGLAVSGSLVSGLASANQISGNATNGSTVVSSTTTLAGEGLNSIAVNVGYSVVQIAIGITVGLFLSNLIVYPNGKKRSGLFSF